MSTISPALVSALRQVLRPLIKLMLAKGLTFTYLVELLKGIFVEVADNDYKINNKPSTDSHLSLLTGIHRKDIKRLRHNSQANSETVPPNISLGTRLVSIWTSDTRFLDENKQPKPLPRFIKEGVRSRLKDSSVVSARIFARASYSMNGYGLVSPILTNSTVFV